MFNEWCNVKCIFILKKNNNLDCINKEKFENAERHNLILIFSQYLANIWLFLYR